MPYQVKLDVFEGPFDLLLQLIARREVDVTEVDLAEITADFLASLADLEASDLETTTQFLVVAATLIEIKAVRLLPPDQREQLEDVVGEARDLLYARLLEYRAFRDAARWLGLRATLERGFVASRAPLERRFRDVVPDTPLPATPGDLAHLAARATAPPAEERIDLSHLRRTYISVREAAAAVLDAVPVPGATTSFHSLAEGLARGDRIVYFLSLLELYKLGELDLRQSGEGGDLILRRRETAGPELDLDVLDDYTSTGGGPARAHGGTSPQSAVDAGTR